MHLEILIIYILHNIQYITIYVYTIEILYFLINDNSLSISHKFSILLILREINMILEKNKRILEKMKHIIISMLNFR